MKDLRILGFLGRALSYEMSAVQWYLTAAQLAESWNDETSAKHFREEVVEELKHAERLVKQMVTYQAIPAASQLRAMPPVDNLLNLLTVCQQLEIELIQLYQQAVDYSVRVADQSALTLFQSLLADEIKHYQDIQQWQAKLTLSRTPV